MNTAIIKIKELYLLKNMSIEEIHNETGYSLEAIKFALKSVKKSNASKMEKTLHSILTEIYPTRKIITQHKIGNQYLDIYIPSLRLGFETDGIQHFEKNTFFGGKTFFQQALTLENQINADSNKNEICKKENIFLIRFSYKQNITEELVRETLGKYEQQIAENLERFANETSLFK